MIGPQGHKEGIKNSELPRKRDSKIQAFLLGGYPDRAPVYFHLASSSDGSANTVVQVAEGERDKLTEEQRGWLFAFGHLAPADELLDDLETAAG